MDSSESSSNIKEIISYLHLLDKRISRIENRLDLIPLPTSDKIEPPKFLRKKSENEQDQLEFQIGQYWFAKVGILVLAIGIAFLLTLPYTNLPSFAPSIIGYIVVGALFGFSKVWKNKYELIARYIFGSALLLLYFSTMRLHFWGSERTIDSVLIIVFCLSVITIVHLYVSFKRESVYLFNIGLALGYITALLSGNDILIFCSIVLLASISSYLKIKKDWNAIFIFSIILSYLTHLLWFSNNPLLGNQLQFVSEPFINVIFLLAYVTIFAVGNLFSSPEEETTKDIISTFINNFAFISLFLLILFTRFKDDLFVSFLIASILFLVMAIILWQKKKSQYSTFFYSIIGYTALSVAIIDRAVVPDVFFWLCWQSLLVMVTAIWFKSRFIIIANFFIYLMIVMVSLALARNAGLLMLSVGTVALLSARILNFQKDRLNLKTELMRNAYLIFALFSIPYSLYILVPSGYVIFTWLAVAILYYILSNILNNKKYRWMALSTLMLTIIYLLIFGITMLDPGLRVLSFIVLGMVLIIISILYTKKRAKINQENDQENDHEN